MIARGQVWERACSRKLLQQQQQLPVVLLPPSQQSFQQLPQHHLRRLGQIRAITERFELLHIGALTQLQLHRMDILRRVAVVTGDMAALEAPIQHMGVLRMLSADGFQLAGQLRVARSAVESTQIERIECASNSNA